MRPGAWTYSLDAREKGGSVAGNFVEALLHGNARTPTQLARFVMESDGATNWASAVKALSTSALINSKIHDACRAAVPARADALAALVSAG